MTAELGDVMPSSIDRLRPSLLTDGSRPCMIPGPGCFSSPQRWQWLDPTTTKVRPIGRAVACGAGHLIRQQGRASL